MSAKNTTTTPLLPSQSILSTLTTFTLLYLTTLFSLDSWAAARASPHRAPGTNASYNRPAASAPEPDSYQGGMHGRGNAGPRGPGDERRGGRDVGVVDSRAPMKMGGSAGCGACLT
ncbi:hypothetical protein T440DRAFT_549873 [Plenodomus tracheiphilus IPT5]|uniref:Uncharacterized protein n=1 Tax=Plenodomus tracheiphilus IPT5 TaxID=1408161 RepID=A0A6A7BM32_9PLEO|nr:hypothetical protein T440DRAFT_549873 [Plenodomus tracheiphilus IPT5]